MLRMNLRTGGGGNNCIVSCLRAGGGHNYMGVSIIHTYIGGTFSFKYTN